VLNVSPDSAESDRFRRIQTQTFSLGRTAFSYFAVAFLPKNAVISAIFSSYILFF
jgi:hypothetical protein